MLLVLLLPATVGLFVLAVPVITLLFEHGSFTAADTEMTSMALRLYLLGLPFAGVDFLLNYTFYARQDTRTPAIVGVLAVGMYLVAAWTLKERMGFLGLVLADSIKQAGHATIMVWLLMGTVGRPSGQGILRTTARSAGASLAMGVAVAVMALLLDRVLASGVIAQLALVFVPATVGAGLYLFLLRLSGVAEAEAVTELLRSRLARRATR
jgi:putative peptidoglycan lipid II flippase